MFIMDTVEVQKLQPIEKYSLNSLHLVVILQKKSKNKMNSRA